MKQNDVLFIVISTTVLIFAWIIFSVRHSAISTTISASLHQEIAPIDAHFDVKTLNQLKNRLQVLPQYSIPVSTTLPSPTPSPSPSLTPPTTITPSITFTPTPTTDNSQDDQTDPCIIDPNLCN